MTTDEAIRRLKEARGTIQPFRYINEAIDFAIKALEQQPITWIVGKDNCQVAVRDMSIDKMKKICAIIGEEEQEPCEDCISRQTAIDIIYEHEYKKDMRKALEELPPVTPQPKTGHWIIPVQDDGTSDPIYYQVRCSKCGFDLDPQTWHMELHQYGADNYCPKCGTKMESEGEE